MKRFFLFFILTSFTAANAQAAQMCSGEDVQSKQAFQTRLNAMKNRISGYGEVLKKNEEYSAQRRQGLENLRKLQWERAIEAAKSRAEFIARRRIEEEKVRLERIAEYNKFVDRRSNKDDSNECEREAYIVQRDHFMQESHRIRELPEEVELGIKPYRQELGPSSPSVPPKSNRSGG